MNASRWPTSDPITPASGSPAVAVMTSSSSCMVIAVQRAPGISGADAFHLWTGQVDPAQLLGEHPGGLPAASECGAKRPYPPW